MITATKATRNRIQHFELAIKINKMNLRQTNRRLLLIFLLAAFKFIASLWAQQREETRAVEKWRVVGNIHKQAIWRSVTMASIAIQLSWNCCCSCYCYGCHLAACNYACHKLLPKSCYLDFIVKNHDGGQHQIQLNCWVSNRRKVNEQRDELFFKSIKANLRELKTFWI